MSSNDARTDLAAIFAEGERLAAEADAAMKSRKRRSSKRRRASSQQQQTGVVAGPTGSSSSSSCPAKRARTAARQEHGKQRQKAPGNGLATRRQSGGKLQRGRGAPDALVMSDLVEARKEKLAATASKETSCSSSQDEVDVVEESSWSFGSVLRDTLRTLSNNFNFSNLFRAANDVIKTTAASPTAGDILDHKDITKDTEEAGATSSQQQPEIDAHVVVDAPPSSPPASNPSEMMDQGRQQTDSSTSTSAAVTTASATISSVADIDAATVVAAAGVNGKQALNNSSSTLVDNSAPLTTIPLSKSPRNTRTAASASALAGRALVEVSPPKLNSKASLGNNRILEQDSKMDLSSRGNGSASVITASSIASSPLQQKQAQSKVTPSSPPSSSFVVGSSTSTATKSNQPSTSSQPLKPQLHPPSLPRASSSSSPALSVIFKSQKPQTSPSSPSLSKIVPSPLAEKRSEPLLRHTQPQQQQQQTETKITITQQALMEEEIGVNDHDSVISLDDSCDKVNPFGYTIQDDSDEERVIVIRGDDEEQAVTAKEELVPSSSPSFVNQHPTSSTATTSSPSKNIASKPNPAVGDDDDVIVISDGEVDQKEEEEDGDLMDTSVPGALSLPVTPAEAAQLPLSNPTGAFHAPLPLPAFRQTIPPSLSSTDAGKSGSVPPPIDHAVSTPLAKQHQQHTSSRSSESQPAATASSSAPMKFIMPQTPAMIFPPSSSDLSNSTPSVRKLYTQQQSLFSSSSSSSSSASVARKLSTSTAVATSTSASFLSSTDSLFSSSSSSSSLRRLNGVGGIKKSSANTSIYRKGGSVYSLVRDAVNQ